MKRLVRFAQALLLLTALLGIRVTYCQQIPRYSQYMMNEFLVNPAVAGSDGRTIVNITGRKEWIGINNDISTPQTYSLSVQHRILDKEVTKTLRASGNKYESIHKSHVGLGLSFVSDYNGAMQKQCLGASYAYHLYLDPAQLSFGLTGSFTQMSIRSKYLNFEDKTDVMYGLSSGSIWIPDVACGINLRGQKFQLGLSAVQLLQSSIIFGNTGVNISSTSLRFKRTYYLLSSYLGNFGSNSRWQYEPSVMIQVNDQLNTGLMTQTNVVLRIIYQKDLWFGAGLRTNNDFIALVGFRFDRLFFTYSFDYGNNEITRYSYGSHELSISVKIGSQEKHIRCKTETKK